MFIVDVRRVDAPTRWRTVDGSSAQQLEPAGWRWGGLPACGELAWHPCQRPILTPKQAHSYIVPVRRVADLTCLAIAFDSLEAASPEWRRLYHQCVDAFGADPATSWRFESAKT